MIKEYDRLLLPDHSEWSFTKVSWKKNRDGKERAVINITRKIDNIEYTMKRKKPI